MCPSTRQQEKRKQSLKGQMSEALAFDVGKHSEKIPAPCSVPFLPFLKCHLGKKKPRKAQYKVQQQRES